MKSTYFYLLSPEKAECSTSFETHAWPRHQWNKKKSFSYTWSFFSSHQASPV